MKKIRVITEGGSAGHNFNKGDIVIRISDCLFENPFNGRRQYLAAEDYEISEDYEDFIVATIEGKRYKCFPMEDGE